MKATVYFSREITPEKVVALYEAAGKPPARQGGREAPLRRGGEPELPEARVLEAHDQGRERHRGGVQHRL